jgi:hypothetical protein
MMDITTQVVDHGDTTGEHWATLAPVGEYLADWLTTMKTALLLTSRQGTATDYERLGLEPGDEVDDWIGWAFLDVAIARWVSTDHAGLCRVELVIATGGPHEEIVGIYDHGGELRSVHAHQFWSGHREALTRSSDALAVFDRFVEAFIYDSRED